jgi:hypothetical protein
MFVHAVNRPVRAGVSYQEGVVVPETILIIKADGDTMCCDIEGVPGIRVCYIPDRNEVRVFNYHVGVVLCKDTVEDNYPMRSFIEYCHKVKTILELQL